jgi:hypothetical protein
MDANGSSGGSPHCLARSYRKATQRAGFKALRIRGSYKRVINNRRSARDRPAESRDHRCPTDAVFFNKYVEISAG